MGRNSIDVSMVFMRSELLQALRELGAEEEELLRVREPGMQLFGAGYVAGLRAVRAWILARGTSHPLYLAPSIVLPAPLARELGLDSATTENPWTGEKG